MDELKGIEIAKRLIKKFLISEYEEEEDNIKFNDISHIPIAHTQTEDGEHDIDVVVDLKSYSINKHLDGTVVESITSKNIGEFISKELTNLNFSDLVYLDDDTIDKKLGSNINDYHFEYTNLANNIYKLQLANADYKKINELWQKLFGLEEILIKSGYTEQDLQGLKTDAYQDAKKEQSLIKGEIKKGDYIKTGANDNTLVLKIKDNDAILFTGNQFIVAHGIQKNGDRAYWMFGDYYDELPDEVFDKDKKMEEEQENDWDMEL